MATAAKTINTDKPKKTPPTLVERVKSQLSGAALRGKVSAEELSTLKAHIDKLSALLS